jgi:fructosamine-3-kinase
MVPPPLVLRAVEAVLESRSGRGVAIRRSFPVGGGCINPSARLESEDGEAFFLKWNPSAPVEMFQAEADGLQGLAAPGTLRVPEVLGWGGSGTVRDPAWLLLEFIPAGSPGPDYGHRLGLGLAQLHSSPPPAESTYGWRRDNFIGSLPQGNGDLPDWVEFWRTRRLAPQLKLARDGGYLSGSEGKVLDELLDRLEEVMAGTEADGPALLHGDLWTGNYYPDGEGNPVLIDPAVYRGAGEVDLAMMELFGGLPRGFREAYGEVRPMAPEYDAFRRDLYQLYYLLVHVNLFGGGYVGGTLRAAARALRGP